MYSSSIRAAPQPTSYPSVTYASPTVRTAGSRPFATVPQAAYGAKTYGAPVTYTSPATYGPVTASAYASPTIRYPASTVTASAYASPTIIKYPAATSAVPAPAPAALSIEHASDNKEGFIKFIKAATSDINSPEYGELYHFLLSCFVESDTDFDGRISHEDFDLMVERAGALPRKWGFAPTSAEMFQTTEARAEFRNAEFAKINTSGTGFIAFDEWLAWSYTHICEKAQLLDLAQAESKMTTSAPDFREFVINACQSRASIEYKELYHFLQDCFTKADKDRDGKVNAAEFDNMIEIAAAAPRKFGFAPPAEQTYQSAEHRIASRTQMMTDMDVDRSGYIAFDEWLTFCYAHICEKAATLQ